MQITLLLNRDICIFGIIDIFNRNMQISVIEMEISLSEMQILVFEIQASLFSIII